MQDRKHGSQKIFYKIITLLIILLLISIASVSLIKFCKPKTATVATYNNTLNPNVLFFKKKKSFIPPEENLPPGVYNIPPKGNDIIGTSQVIVAQSHDTFAKISQNFDITESELQIANSDIKPNNIKSGTRILLPIARILPPEKYRKGIVINIPELRLYYFTSHGTVMSFPVALGRSRWRTPVGLTRVTRKVHHPDWHPPQSIRDHYQQKNHKELPIIIPAGKNNPLGDYAIFLNLPGYLIHGTNNPSSIGKLVSSGCIRMYNEDVAKLYQEVEPGTPVQLIYYPVKAGWKDNQLYLEAYSPVKHIEGLYEKNSLDLMEVITEADPEKKVNLNIQKIHEIIKQQNGDPQVISQP